VKTTFISGANRGLGFSLAKLCLESGNHVFAGTRSPSAPLAELEGQYPGAMHLVVLDVSSEESVRAAAEAVGRIAGRLDLIVNNAALLHRESATNPIERIDLDAAAETLDVNAMGPLRVLKYFLPLLNEGPKKMVVNISSEAGSIADCQRDAWYAYCMSKAALNMASMILQNYLRQKGVKVLAVHPGWMRSRMGGEDAKYDPQESARAILALSEREWSIDGPVFIDHTGAPLRW
jgi:NAD(P)-dependent dehydrogenase (short-subunit alcohol dehydrogenase family)